MSNKRLTAVWEHSKQKGTSLLALLSLADRADDDGFCWPSHVDTAHRARSKRTYVLTVLQNIENDGELFIHPRPGRSSQYLVLPGLTFSEVQNSLVKRFAYSNEESQKIIEEIATLGGVCFTDTSVLHNTLVSVLQTSGVSPTEHEPSSKPQPKPKTKARSKFAPVPESLNTTEFTITWTEFIQYRLQSRKKMTLISQKKMLNKLANYSSTVACQMLEKSMTNGWQGVYPPKGSNGSTPPKYDKLPDRPAVVNSDQVKGLRGR